MSPPTEPPKGVVDVLIRTAPNLFDNLQTPKRLCQGITNVCSVAGVVFMFVPIETIGKAVGWELHAVMPWWGYLSVAVLATVVAFAGETFCSNEQERVRRNGVSAYVCLDAKTCEDVRKPEAEPGVADPVVTG